MRPGKMFGGILLILIGASVLFSMIGIHLGGIIGLAIGAWLLYWGYSNWKQKGWCLSSIILFILGGCIILGGLGGIMSLLVGILLIYGGYRLVKPSEKNEDDGGFTVYEREERSKSTYDTIDEEFSKLINEK